jgi:ribosomal protein S18 acetylase RimI-like enzyme
MADMVTVTRLDESRWQDYRDLRLEALKEEPLAYGSSYEEELPLSEAEWCKHLQNVLFAVIDGKPAGMIVYVRDPRLKTNHICNIYSVYIRKQYRGRGISKTLMEAALTEIKRLPGVVKVCLTVNPTQKAAAHLYRESGFKVIGKPKKSLKYNGIYYNEWLMEKYL